MLKRLFEMVEGFEIKFQYNNKVYSICVGHRTKWFSQIPYIMVIEEFYDRYEVEYAEVLWRSKD